MDKQHLLNWLKIAFQQPIDNDVEDFYFDKKSNCFFSITHLEKLLIDKNFKIQYNLSPYFSDEELKTIQKWTKKIKKSNNSIVKVPSYGIINDEEELTESINQFLFKNAIRLSNATIFNVIQKEVIPRIHTKKEVKPTKTWWKFW
jgi:hypothetical protein